VQFLKAIVISSAVRSSGISRPKRRACLETTLQSRYKLTGPSHNSFMLVRARKILSSAAIPDFRAWPFPPQGALLASSLLPEVGHES
jgi:hypothetical protein